jgi:hypothetical protein
VASAKQLDQVLEAWQHGSSTVAARSRGEHSARVEEQSDDFDSLSGIAWWPAA